MVDTSKRVGSHSQSKKAKESSCSAYLNIIHMHAEIFSVGRELASISAEISKYEVSK